MNDEYSHIIRIGNKFEIDTIKVKKYLKRGFKFAFSQIGLAGLVVGYVILGALMFMKIESDYEREIQIQKNKNRDEFYSNVKMVAEEMFNDYLKKHFHTEYSKFRIDEIIEKEKEEMEKSLRHYNNKSQVQVKRREAVNAEHQLHARYKRDPNAKTKKPWFIELVIELF
jgi:hypothetical protein